MEYKRSCRTATAAAAAADAVAAVALLARQRPLQCSHCSAQAQRAARQAYPHPHALSTLVAHSSIALTAAREGRGTGPQWPPRRWLRGASTCGASACGAGGRCQRQDSCYRERQGMCWATSNVNSGDNALCGFCSRGRRLGLAPAATSPPAAPVCPKYSHSLHRAPHSLPQHTLTQPRRRCKSALLCVSACAH